MHDNHGRRQERVRLQGTLRLLVEGRGGFLVGAGELVDLSASGCAMRVRNRAIEADMSGRIDIAVAGVSLTLPILTRWIRKEKDGWIVGCAFGDLTTENQAEIHALLSETSAIVI